MNPERMPPPSPAFTAGPHAHQGSTRVSLWRAKAIAFVRFAFGIVWAVAAWLKWQPKFIDSFKDQVSGSKDGQPGAVQSWISFWTNLVGTNPHFFAYLTNLTCVVGILYSLGVWSVAEGFGGPYKPGDSTDVGTALPYAVLFAVLLAIGAGRYYSVDQWLTPRLGRFGFLASGVPWRRR